ncbi:MAG: pentapeptide repeat-containing protein [Synechococcaceae cyanobacterium SM2_3_1]|nr:pentapeptide repeat-containing protein [Synechococcaceae cyanobacterium SM2_3_1]
MLRTIRQDAGCNRVTHPAQLLQCYTEGQRDFQSAHLPGADLWYADLAGVSLRGADLQGADLRYANLRDANLEYACLDDADLWEAELQGANLRGASLDHARSGEPSTTTPPFLIQLYSLNNWGYNCGTESCRHSLSDMLIRQDWSLRCAAFPIDQPGLSHP